MQNAKPISQTTARQLGDSLGVDWRTIGVDEFRLGLEFEAGRVSWDTEANIAFDDTLKIGRLALGRLSQIPDFYSQQKAMEEESDAYWANT